MNKRQGEDELYISSGKHNDLQPFKFLINGRNFNTS